MTTGAPAGANTQDRNDRRKARTRGKLLMAARGLFALRGFEQTTIRDVAAEADVALGSFYNYFRTKDELLGALLEDALTEQLRQLVARRQQVADVAERVSIAHRHLLASVRADPDWGWLLVRLDVDHRVVYSALGAQATADLQEGIASGRFCVINPLLALRASGGALLGVVHGVLLGEFAEADDCAHAEGVLRSFGVPAGEAAEIARRPLPAMAA